MTNSSPKRTTRVTSTSSNPVATGKLYDSHPPLIVRKMASVLEVKRYDTWFDLHLSYVVEDEDFWYGMVTGEWLRWLEPGVQTVRHKTTRREGTIKTTDRAMSDNYRLYAHFMSDPLDTLGPYTHATDEQHTLIYPYSPHDIDMWT
jgi:hypothetical protein